MRLLNLDLILAGFIAALRPSMFVMKFIASVLIKPLLCAMPLPAPTARHVRPIDPFELRRLLPSTIGLRKTKTAMHENLVLLAMHADWD